MRLLAVLTVALLAASPAARAALLPEEGAANATLARDGSRLEAGPGSSPMLREAAAALASLAGDRARARALLADVPAAADDCAQRTRRAEVLGGAPCPQVIAEPLPPPEATRPAPVAARIIGARPGELRDALLAAASVSALQALGPGGNAQLETTYDRFRVAGEVVLEGLLYRDDRVLVAGWRGTSGRDDDVRRALSRLAMLRPEPIMGGASLDGGPEAAVPAPAAVAPVAVAAPPAPVAAPPAPVAAPPAPVAAPRATAAPARAVADAAPAAARSALAGSARALAGGWQADAPAGWTCEGASCASADGSARLTLTVAVVPRDSHRSPIARKRPAEQGEAAPPGLPSTARATARVTLPDDGGADFFTWTDSSGTARAALVRQVPAGHERVTLVVELPSAAPPPPDWAVTSAGSLRRSR